MKKRNIPRPVEQSGRRRFGRSQWDHILDPYKRVHKLHEPTVCPQCGAIFTRRAGIGRRDRWMRTRSYAKPATVSTISTLRVS